MGIEAFYGKLWVTRKLFGEFTAIQENFSNFAAEKVFVLTFCPSLILGALLRVYVVDGIYFNGGNLLHSSDEREKGKQTGKTFLCGI